ncbi:hypothetical protein VULLAG_LOCUS14491 [Vulpes lagopus]
MPSSRGFDCRELRVCSRVGRSEAMASSLRTDAGSPRVWKPWVYGATQQGHTARTLVYGSHTVFSGVLSAPVVG